MRKRIDPPPWPWLDRPRVLLENPDREASLEAADTLRHAGYAVAVCHGPAADTRCPLACSESCALVEGADVVVTSLGQERAESREVLDLLQLRYASRPLVVEEHPGALDPEELLAAVRNAISA